MFTVLFGMRGEDAMHTRNVCARAGKATKADFPTGRVHLGGGKAERAYLSIYFSLVFPLKRETELPGNGMVG